LSPSKRRLTGEHIELVLEDTDSPSNLAATGQNDDVLVRLRPELLGRNSNQASRLWLWAAADNLRLNAQNAVQCALDLAANPAAGHCAVRGVSNNKTKLC
jgi:aspartate-semialdehyde dehydrogenase